MTHLAFLIWMIVYPLVIIFADYTYSKLIPNSEKADFKGDFAFFLIYVIVGYNLF
jgi:uncharacterized membrane protein